CLPTWEFTASLATEAHNPYQPVIAQLMAPEAGNSLVDGTSSLRYPGSVAASAPSKQKQNKRSNQRPTEETPGRKKQRLEKNKEAARINRGKQKEHIRTLKDRIAKLTEENNSIREEIKALKQHL
uniref:BZIP domain-containing protein n=1 Tax=Gouania willdenowi TaxID=441366 RepID=A0A8C5IAC8_GOUWI